MYAFAFTSLSSSPIFHLSFICSHLHITCISLVALMTSHLLLPGCYISFILSSNLQHTLLPIAIPLRSSILLASQSLFVALGSFWYPCLLLHICFFLASLGFYSSSFVSFPLHHHPSFRTFIPAWDILSLRSILHLIASPSLLTFSLASLLAVGWATCIIALHALHCAFFCSKGPCSHHYLHASR